MQGFLDIFKFSGNIWSRHHRHIANIVNIAFSVASGSRSKAQGNHGRSLHQDLLIDAHAIAMLHNALISDFNIYCTQDWNPSTPFHDEFSFQPSKMNASLTPQSLSPFYTCNNLCSSLKCCCR
jgi:hypothetical protein